jgi:hypothetical protein
MVRSMLIGKLESRDEVFDLASKSKLALVGQYTDGNSCEELGIGGYQCDRVWSHWTIRRVPETLRTAIEKGY